MPSSPSYSKVRRLRPVTRSVRMVRPRSVPDRRYIASALAASAFTGFVSGSISSCVLIRTLYHTAQSSSPFSPRHPPSALSPVGFRRRFSGFPASNPHDPRRGAAEVWLAQDGGGRRVLVGGAARVERAHSGAPRGPRFSSPVVVRHVRVWLYPLAELGTPPVGCRKTEASRLKAGLCTRRVAPYASLSALSPCARTTPNCAPFGSQQCSVPMHLRT